MMRSFVVDVPVELEEAAIVDGCFRWQTLRLILDSNNPAIIFISLTPKYMVRGLTIGAIKG
jgi:ABC-type glycerol-3-phosphate transport system permease component